MKFLVLIVGLCAVSCLALPAPQSDDARAETLKLVNDNNGVDKYSFSYETSNGISRSEEGQLKPGAGADSQGAISVQGTTTWTAPDGKKYETTFTADETGYHPTFKLVA